MTDKNKFINGNKKRIRLINIVPKVNIEVRLTFINAVGMLNVEA